MKFSLQPEHLKRYRDVARLLIRHGRRDLIIATEVDEAVLRDPAESEIAADGSPEKLARDLECLGPTYVKLGQLLSTRADLLSRPYLDALSRLQDDVAPVPFERVRQTVEEALGMTLSQAFAEFDPEPIAAASLAQVHRAQLRDGRTVAVKVQRPGIRQVVLGDLDAFEGILALVERHSESARRYALHEVFRSFRKALLRELDFEREAGNLDELAENLQRYPRLVVPRPVHDYTTSRVLTMDFVRGIKVSSVTPEARLELDTRGLVEDLTRGYLDQVLVHGFFHADPHPGNILLTDDGRLALVDVGQVARLSPGQRERLLKLLLAAADGNVDDAVDVLVQLGGRQEDYDEVRFHRHVADLMLEHRNDAAGEVPLGRMLMESTRLAVQCGVGTSPELGILGKTLLHLDEVGRVLDPEFQPRDLIRRHGQSLLRRHLLHQMRPGRAFSTVLEINEFLRNLPQRMNRLLNDLVSRRFEIRVHAFDEKALLHILQQSANRLAVAIVLAAIIVGAAMLMRVDTAFRLFGYPGFAIILFLLAAVMGMGLVVHIWLRDVYRGRRAPPPS